MTEYCIICTDAIRSFALGDCGHRGLCSRCYIINMKHYNRRSCVTCKGEFGVVLLTQNPVKPLSEFNLTAMRISRQFENTYFENRQECRTFEDLFAVACPACSMKCSSVRDLKNHVRNEHKLNFCDVCLKKRKGIVLREQRLYDPKDLNRHRLYGDPATETEGSIEAHVKCSLCKELCYDIDDRNMHMLETHVCCQLCRRRNTEEWAIDNNALLAHYRNAHLTCDDPQCLAAPMENVYDDEISLRSHILKVHGDSLKSKQMVRDTQRVNIDFRRRPAAGPSVAVGASDDGSMYNDERRDDTVSLAGDAREQNKTLMNEIRRLKGADGLHSFRNISGQFFKGELSPEAYYDYFSDNFGGCATAGSLWMLLVSSLPEPSLRSELYRVHYENIRKGGGFNAETRALSAKLLGSKVEPVVGEEVSRRQVSKKIKKPSKVNLQINSDDNNYSSIPSESSVAGPLGSSNDSSYSFGEPKGFSDDVPLATSMTGKDILVAVSVVESTPFHDHSAKVDGEAVVAEEVGRDMTSKDSSSNMKNESFKEERKGATGSKKGKGRQKNILFRFG